MAVYHEIQWVDLNNKGNSIVEEMQLNFASNISALKPAMRLGACWFNGGMKLSSGLAIALLTVHNTPFINAVIVEYFQ